MYLSYSVRTTVVIVVVAAVAWFAVVSSGKRQIVRVVSADGSCVFHCVQKERIIKTGKYGGWIFSDSEPDWVASSAHLEIDGILYRLPFRLVRKMANPHSIRMLTVDRSSQGMTVSFSGGDGAGSMRLALKFVGGKLVRAEADTVASYTPTPVYP
jgi:hypothetical protein